MIEKKSTDSVAPGGGISEAQRMAKIRELLVGPVIADESAREDQSFDRLNDFVKQQQETITALQTRIQELEDRQSAGMSRLNARFLGVVEALLADEETVRSRLVQSEILQPIIKINKGTSGA